MKVVIEAPVIRADVTSAMAVTLLEVLILAELFVS